MTFSELQITTPILRAIEDAGYSEPTPIQTQAIPVLLSGRDLIGSAQTGTGKTAAFAIPIIQKLSSQPVEKSAKRTVRALILAPTRELAAQIGENITTYGKYTLLKTAVVFGGVSQYSQVRKLKAGVDILIATAGRLLDLLKQKVFDLNDVEVFVLDEADMMLDMGFIVDIQKIIKKLPETRQNMMFSATMPTEIEKLADTFLKDPIRLAVTPVEATIDAIEQKLYYVDKSQKSNLLVKLLRNTAVESALVFVRTKHGADKLVKDLTLAGINVDAIHGNKSQQARQFTLGRFKDKKIRVLVATDIAARGLDIAGLSHVFNYDLPDVPEVYIHRMGRTGRAGFSGTAVTFCSREDAHLIRVIQKHIGLQIPLAKDNPFAPSDIGDFANAAAPLKGRRGGSGRSSSNRGSSGRSYSGNRDSSRSYGSHEGYSSRRTPLTVNAGTTTDADVTINSSVEPKNDSENRGYKKPYASRSYSRPNTEGGERSYQRRDGESKPRTYGERSYSKPTSEGGERSYQRRDGESKPRTYGERSYSKPTSEGGERSYQRRDGESKPRTYGERSYSKPTSEGGEHRSYQRRDGESKPRTYGERSYSKPTSEGGEHRSYQRRDGEFKPRTYGERSYSKPTSEGGEHRSYQRRDGESKPRTYGNRSSSTRDTNSGENKGYSKRQDAFKPRTYSHSKPSDKQNND